MILLKLVSLASFRNFAARVEKDACRSDGLPVDTCGLSNPRGYSVVDELGAGDEASARRQVCMERESGLRGAALSHLESA